MNKSKLRWFSSGIFFTVCIMSLVYFFQAGKDEDISINEAKNALVAEDYVVLKKAEYQTIQDQIKAQNKPQKSEDEEAQQSEKPIEENNTSGSIVQYQLEIVSGMTLNDIATLLADHKIIQDKTAFTNLLINEGYDKKIQLGSYALTSQMTDKEIADIIT